MERDAGDVKERADKSRWKERINRARPLSTHLSAIREHPSAPRVSRLAPRTALILRASAKSSARKGEYEGKRKKGCCAGGSGRCKNKKLTDSVTCVNKRFPSRGAGDARTGGIGGIKARGRSTDIKGGGRWELFCTRLSVMTGSFLGYANSTRFPTYEKFEKEKMKFID